MNRPGVEGLASAEQAAAPAAEWGGAPDPIAGTLTRIGLRYAGDRGFMLGRGAERHFRGAMVTAARRIRSQARTVANQNAGPATSPDLQDILVEQAGERVRQLIDAMVTAHGALPGYAERRPSILGEHTYFAAVAQLGALWPIL